ncbi:hypothetical protein AS156_23105 [Bradyrhizobium macuxiense]|uniref:Uncharacterized protein n=1 Tax=Bradyrhizobium macuxiense TaxID=1755647 RepID=A0A109JBK5_9BRAD|nr:DUF2303 family protein [Bradyrhizobium macuxiense]KWV45903.1 hypothetical protein AS156_23105 [Bradyrhizobium macuxiense]
MDQATNLSTTSHFPFHNHADRAFIDQLVNVDQSQSLIDYVNRFKTAETVIFADVDELEVHAVIDYHTAGSAKAGFGEHRAVLCLSRSYEWDTWNAISGRMYDHKAFAHIIDVNSDDIASPAAALLLATARKVEGAVLPPFFTLRIPVFTGELKVDVRAMTNDSQDGNAGKSLGLELVRTRVIIETEFSRIADEIAAATSVPVIMGSVRD